MKSSKRSREMQICRSLLLTECDMLDAMAMVGRWQSHPLHYSHRLCSPSASAWSLLLPWGSGGWGMMQVILASCLSFCGNFTTNHFYRADPALLVLTCSYTESKLPWPCPQGSASQVPYSSSLSPMSSFSSPLQ